MACAKSSFYLPKDSAKAQMLEAKANLLRLRQDIPLQDAVTRQVVIDSASRFAQSFIRIESLSMDRPSLRDMQELSKPALRRRS
jgi:hypothetical protein